MNLECFVEDLFLGGQWSIILGYRRLSVKSLLVYPVINQRNGFITCSKEKEIINWDEDRPQRRDTSSFLVWITLGFSWVLPLVLGLDAWLFSLHLQSCEAIILQRSREVSANYLKSWDCEAVGLLLRKIQVIHRQIIMEWDSKDERQKTKRYEITSMRGH